MPRFFPTLHLSFIWSRYLEPIRAGWWGQRVRRARTALEEPIRFTFGVLRVLLPEVSRAFLLGVVLLELVQHGVASQASRKKQHRCLCFGLQYIAMGYNITILAPCQVHQNGDRKSTPHFHRCLDICELNNASPGSPPMSRPWRGVRIVRMCQVQTAVGSWCNCEKL